jgi:Spy/CpxP family protein refolding chaperone
MKIFSKIALLILGLAAAPLPFLAAATTDTTTSNSTPTTAKVHHRHLRAMAQRRKARAHVAARRLGLSQDQVAQLKTLRAQTRSSLKGIRSDSSLTREQKQAKARELRQGARTQALGSLTPDQQAQLKQLRKKRQSLRQGLL